MFRLEFSQLNKTKETQTAYALRIYVIDCVDVDLDQIYAQLTHGRFSFFQIEFT